MIVWPIAAGAIVVVVGLAARVLRRKNIDVIARAALHARLAARPRPAVEGPRHLFVSVVDHFEPFWRNRDPALARERVARWRTRYPEIADRFRDRGGNPPRHTFFYPEEEYPLDPGCMEPLAEMQRQGFAEVEIHLHHDRDDSESLRGKLEGFKHTLRNHHGLLRDDPVSGAPVYAFIHGNWVLGNSGRGGEYCGVDDELLVLRETGCYADFTLPSAPHRSQPPVSNRIYYPAGDPRAPRAHFHAIDAARGVPPRDGPLIVTGPLCLNWKQRRRGVLPSVENGDLTGDHPPSPDRVDAWVRCGIGVVGFPRWVFVKAYTHGAQERNAARLLADGPGGLGGLFQDLLARYDDGERFVLHFSTPWEIFRAIRVLETNDDGAIQAIERFEYRF